ncbi:MAG: hypothetical protein GF393_05170 [Armatimonadia bacterium]|nr:hypothetical protein [Armatimonadia bacterium]
MVAEGVFTTANLVSYCAAEDVLALLQAYDTSEWGSEEELLIEATEALVSTRSAIEAAAGRDFFLHADETVVLDGSGTRVLLLAPLGLTPVVAVDAVSVDGRELDECEWLFYPDEAAIVLAASSSLGRYFPEGSQNVEITLDWGYEVTPGDVVSAQAKLAASEMLARHTGEQGGVEAVSLGDYTVRYGADGRFAQTIRRLVAEAREAVARYRRIDFCAI